MRELRNLCYSVGRLLGWAIAGAGGGMKLIRRIANAIIGRKLVSKLWWR
jgi:hypothetical protein